LIQGAQELVADVPGLPGSSADDPNGPLLNDMHLPSEAICKACRIQGHKRLPFGLWDTAPASVIAGRTAL